MEQIRLVPGKMRRKARKHRLATRDPWDLHVEEWFVRLVRFIDEHEGVVPPGNPDRAVVGEIGGE